jgi:hypothetical protein
LGDGLLLLVEGAFASGQLFGKAGPALAVGQAAEALIDAQASRRAAPRPPRPDDDQPSLF